MDLQVSPQLTIPASELGWRFSRSSGPGGQHVNTSDSRVQLSWNVAASAVLSDAQRQRLLGRLDKRLIAGELEMGLDRLDQLSADDELILVDNGFEGGPAGLGELVDRVRVVGRAHRDRVGATLPAAQPGDRLRSAR